MHIMNLRTQSGFSLIEALVALIVLSVGMIGIAALYGQGLSAGRTALYRQIAINLAGEMADRVRSNRTARVAYNAAIPNPVPACGPGGGVDCTPAQLAGYDRSIWETLVGQQLPGGVGTVVYAPGTPPTYTITVSWQDVTGATQYQITPQIPLL